MAGLGEGDRTWLAGPLVALKLACVSTTGKGLVACGATKQRLSTLLSFRLPTTGALKKMT